ncbi:TetR/AcrR family transcriptional regulator [Acidovorax sp. MR-S7]|uniref:TetR/AcrR family transcriptional regulator n=1 Tax=Acidovorax sp. MR-S7 TaxID=1268622 RepID=UPI0003D3FCE8|nr:TetR/AcrR family transcriptional regulator [Acidovorax sp. MR-S7]GAD21148.1 transcriptional regulator [Acidovorax sp. MR-S7]
MILRQARACVLEHGFAGLTMSRLSERTRLSAGQIYRYFDNKEAIVHAIMEGIAAWRLERIEETGLRMDWAHVFASRMANADTESVENQLLVLHMTAEAFRDPAVAKIVSHSDAQTYAACMRIFRTAYPDLVDSELAARYELMTVLAQGSVQRRIAPEPMDVKAFEHCLRTTLAGILPT